MSTETKGRKCDGKRRHSTRARALAAIRELVSRGAAPGALKAYACQYCSSWHVGHRSPRQRRGRA
jgi:hypothetical protein